MASTNDPQQGGLLGPIGQKIAGQALQALPPEIQDLLKPGPQSDRINKAIGWAARRDPQVIRLHQQHGAKNVRTLEDIRALPLERMDDVAQHVARLYRHRAAMTGALTGLPGGLWALAAAGADVQLTAIYAVRMAAGVAQAYGYDTSAPQEMAQLADVLALVAGVDSLRGIGNWLTREGLIHYLPEVLPKLVVRIGGQITKEQAGKLIGRLVPGVGAAIGGVIDYSFLRVAGDKAINFYHQRYLVDHGLAAPSVQPGAAIAALPAGVGRTVDASAGAVAPVVIPHSTPTRRDRPPERFGVYLAVFAVIAMFITIAACTALVILVTSGGMSLFTRFFTGH
ncbi:MAG TPA: EcsC family protein [Ktedonobacterales bacterium]|nr:EcsC family protein [Ktedonobacterales bacterium]